MEKRTYRLKRHTTLSFGRVYIRCLSVHRHEGALIEVTLPDGEVVSVATERSPPEKPLTGPPSVGYLDG